MGKIGRLLRGKLGTHCSYCGELVPEGEGFRVLAMQVYCNEGHAVEDQENNPV